MTATTIGGRVSAAESEERGRAARSETPRSSHATWEAPRGRRDPVELLEEQAQTRVPDLLPIRYGRMAHSPFTFYRGAAYVMAADLATTPQTGFTVQLCGDAHLANFGVFSAPDRQLVFDLNDFDETAPGPWEWDVKRLVASFAVAGRDRGFDEDTRRRVVMVVTARYRETLRQLAGSRNLDVWYARLNIDPLYESLRGSVSRAAEKRVDRSLAKARRKDSMRALAKLCTEVDGERRFVNDPPLLVRFEELLADTSLDADLAQGAIEALLSEYRATLTGEVRHLLESYRLVDVARKVVGVGSVGTRAYVVLLQGRDGQDPLMLQVKEAQQSVLEPFTAPSTFPNAGQRVVEGQRLMQAAGDIALGWIHTLGIDGRERDFYVRQLWDGKASADLEAIEPHPMEIYGHMCGWTLARAHARSGDRIAIARYLGSGKAFDRAMADFAEAYAEQNEADHRTFTQAIESGRLTAEYDV